MGIERVDALRLSEAYLKDGNTEVTISNLKAWARSVDLTGIQKILSGPNNREIDYDTINILRSE